MQKLSRKAEQSFFGMLILTDFLTQQPFLQNNSDNILKSVHSYNHSFRCAQAQNVMKMVACALLFNWSCKYTTEHGEVSASPSLVWGVRILICVALPSQVQISVASTT